MAAEKTLRDWLKEEITTWGDKQEARLWLSEQITRIAQLNYEIPHRYGDSVRYFRRLDPEISIRMFVEYAKERGAILDV